MCNLEPDRDSLANGTARSANENGRWLRSVEQNGSAIVFVLNADGRLRDVSPALEEVLGYRAKDLLGTMVFDYVHPEDLERVSKAFTEAYENPNVAPPIEFLARAADGSWRHMVASWNNLLDDPDTQGFVLYARDDTKRVLAEEKLEESE